MEKQLSGREYQPILEQAVGDVRNGGRRQSRLLRQCHAGDGTVDTNRVQGHALVVVAGAL